MPTNKRAKGPEGPKASDCRQCLHRSLLEQLLHLFNFTHEQRGVEIRRVGNCTTLRGV